MDETEDRSAAVQSPTNVDSSINAMIDDSRDEIDIQLDEKVSGVKRALLQSPEEKKSKRKSTSSSSSARTESPERKSGSSSVPTTSTKATPKSSTKSTPSKASTAVKKKKLQAAEAQEEEIKATIEKLKKDRTRVQSKLNKLLAEDAVNSASAPSAPKETTQEILLSATSVLDAVSRAENFFPADVVDDALTVWNFLNTFNKQLLLQSVSWDDFSALIKFTGRASSALSDLFCGPLRLILSDATSLQKINALLPKRTHFHSSDEENNHIKQLDVESVPADQLTATFSNAETFDHEFNGFKLFAHRLSVDVVDHIRWPCVLRAVLLRLEPVKQLRKAVLEVAMAFDFVAKQRESQQQQQLQQKHQTEDEEEDEDDEGEEDRGTEVLRSTAKLAKVLAVGTTPRKRARFEVSEETIDEDESGNHNELVPLSAEAMERINTPRSKSSRSQLSNSSSRKKTAGLNKDAIFSITTSYTACLERIHDAAAALEQTEVHALSPLHKITLLKTLCEACYDTQRIQELLYNNGEERSAQIAAQNKKLRDLKATKKETAQARREDAIAVCKALNKAAAANGDGKGDGKKKKGSGSSSKSDQPTNEQINAMVEDLVMLEEYGVQSVVPDIPLEEVSDDEEEESNEGENSNGDASDSNGRRSKAGNRAKAADRKRARDERRYRNLVLEQAYQKLAEACEAKTEKMLRSAIRNAERVKLRWREGSSNGKVVVTQSLKQAYKALSEIEQKAKEDREAVKYERTLEEYFVRTVPLGYDRFGNGFWHFPADEHRLFVQVKCSPNNSNITSQIASGSSALAPPTEGMQQHETVLSKLFAARPSNHQYTWRIYASRTELWRLCSALNETIEGEKELKAKLRACFELEEPSVDYVSEGHEWIGRKVQRVFGRRVVLGTVIAWAPPANEDAPLWHVLHEDGDEEDLDEDEVRDNLVDEAALEAARLEKAAEMEVDGEDNQVIELDKEGGESEKDGDGEQNKYNNDDDDEEVEFDYVKKPTGASKETGSKAEIEEPRLVRLAQGLSRSANASRAVLYPAGVAGVRVELLRLLQVSYDALKKRGGAVDRESKRVLETALKAAETPAQMSSLLLGIEELFRSVQVASDRLEAEEIAQQKAEQRAQMIEEGWSFEVAQYPEVLGRRARRFFKGFGLSDGIITACLPADQNEGVQLYRMEHGDGDEEDLDEKDVQRALLALEENWLEDQPLNSSANATRTSNADGIDDVNAPAIDSTNVVEDGSEAESDYDSDEDVIQMDEDGDENEALNGYPVSAAYASARVAGATAVLDGDERRLWPTAEVRSRWRTAVTASATTGELAMAIAVLEEFAAAFGLVPETPTASSSNALFGTTDNGNLLLHAGAQRRTAHNTSGQRNSSNSRSKQSQQQKTSSGGHHSMLSPRKAKKAALGEIARQSRLMNSAYESNSDQNSDGGNFRRSSRNASSNALSGGDVFHNSGRPSRSAAQKVASYAE